MKTRTFLGALLATGLLIGSVPAQDCSNPADGPDVIVGEINGVGNYGGTGGVGGYSLGTDACNVGTEVLDWFGSTNQHPVIAQNAYRLENGRIEQIGMSWLKHGFAALQGPTCCACTPSGSGQQLGVGCSDPYGWSLNGSQSGLGPRFQVNPVSGEFSYPFFAQGSSGNQVYKRMQIANADLDPALHPTALYFGEGQYVHPDDAMAGNAGNNTSYRPLVVNGFSSGSWNLGMSGTTQRTKPAIEAWKDNDPSVTLTLAKIVNDGQFYVASKATDNGDGTWNYEYAIQNLTSDVGLGSFSVPIPAGATVTKIGFHDVDYHSGEPYSNTDWVGVHAGDSVSWATDSFASNPDANAIRWGTLYNFRFDADVPPDNTTATVGCFKPSVPGSVSVNIQGPAGPWTDLGNGLAGGAGVPLLAGSGDLTAGSSTSLELTSGLPNGTTNLVLGFTNLSAPFKGGVLVPNPDVLLANLPLNGSGSLNIAFSWPGGIPSASDTFWQHWIADPAGPAGFSASNAVQGTTP